MLTSPFGHCISYLRVSITDRCNERCRYCIPDEVQEWLPREEVLSYEEIIRLIRIGASLGIRKLRVTGGEPLARAGVIGFFQMLRDNVPELTDLGISTNGTLLNRKVDSTSGRDGETFAKALRARGVRSANISLDTLDAKRYAEISGRNYLDRALSGIDAAIAAQFPGGIKINCVLMRNCNEADLPELVEFCGEKGLLLRFIELMPVSTRDILSDENFLSTGEARRQIEAAFGKLEPVADFRTNGPAVYYRLPGSTQKIGFIGALTTPHFCESCNKLRLTCEGKLRPCLGSWLEFDIKAPLRAGASDDELRELFLQVVQKKPEKHDFLNNYQPNRRMVAIGG